MKILSFYKDCHHLAVKSYFIDNIENDTQTFSRREVSPYLIYANTNYKYENINLNI